MRENLFRGKRKDNGEWVKGHLQVTDERYFILSDDAVQFNYPDFLPKGIYMISGFVEVDPDTVGQYTCASDKNDVKIFEGDIVIHNHHRYVIRYLPKYFRFAGTKPGCVFAAFIPSSCEIIGNIHDNPELMEVGND